MSDKIKTGDCVKAICKFFVDYSGPSPLPKDELCDPSQWKRLSKTGNKVEGFVRVFAHKGVDAKAEKMDSGLQDRMRWGVAIRSTEDEIIPGVGFVSIIDGKVEGGLSGFGAMKSLMIGPVNQNEYDDYIKNKPALAAVKDEEVRDRLTKVLGFKPASYEEMYGKGSASEPLTIDDEEAWKKVYGEDYKKFPTDAFGQPEPPADPLVPGGAIHLSVDKEFPAIERSSRKYIKLMEATCGEDGCKFTRKKIKPGAVFLFLSPDDAKVEDVLTFPNGGVAYIDSDEGPFPDYGAVDNLFLEDDVGNVWLAGGEPQDDTKTVDECWSGKDLKRAKDAIAKYGASVVIRHM